MCVRRVPVTLRFLEQFLQGDVRPATSTLPRDARIVGVQWRDLERYIEFFVESNKFSRTPEGHQIEEFVPKFTAVK